MLKATQEDGGTAAAVDGETFWSVQEGTWRTLAAVRVVFGKENRDFGGWGDGDRACEASQGYALGPCVGTRETPLAARVLWEMVLSLSGLHWLGSGEMRD